MALALRSLLLAAIVALATTVTAQAAGELTKDAVNAAPYGAAESSGAVSAQTIKAGVLLDRAQASPGVIDGKVGDNFRKALASYAETHDMPAPKGLSEPLWQALTRDTEPALVDYTITEKDVAGPFIDTVPKDYGEMAKLKALSYTGPVELLASRFHMDERLLKQLNPKVDFAKAGTVIVVANVKRDPIKAKIVRIDIDKTTARSARSTRTGSSSSPTPRRSGATPRRRPADPTRYARWRRIRPIATTPTRTSSRARTTSRCAFRRARPIRAERGGST